MRSHSRSGLTRALLARACIVLVDAGSAGELGARRADSIQVMRGVAAMLAVLTHAVDVVIGNPDYYSRSYLVNAGYVEDFGAVGG